MSRARKHISKTPVFAHIESLDHDGRGVARVTGKLVFIDGGLPGEQVMFRYRRRRGQFDEGSVVEVLKPSSDRVPPHCPHFGVCGGCSLQHLDPGAQLRFKEARLLHNLAHEGASEPEDLLPAVSGRGWGYRRKARLGARYVAKKGRVLVGFREKASSFVADLSRCDILHPAIGDHLESLKRVVAALEACRQIPQVEVAAGDDSVALVFRHLMPLSDTDCETLREFAVQHGFRVYLQSGGPDTVKLLHPQDGEQRLGYRLVDWNVEIRFHPTDFAQVNGEMNGRMVAQALDLLDVGSQDRILDLFCGLGNFTLPLARQVARVVGVESDLGLVQRARENARRNGIRNAEFLALDLRDSDAGDIWGADGYDKVLLDPPRSGASAIISAMRAPYPKRVVYVSCNSETFARDAGELVRRHGYRLSSAGVVDMFPHTSHAESIALFQQ